MADLDFERHYSDRARRAVASDIREILKMLDDPELISFAGGIPNPDAFPVAVISDITQKVLDRSPSETLQYGVTEGFSPLREALSEHMGKHGLATCPDEVMVTSGATQTIDLCSQAFLQPGRRVVTESPSFLAALLAFKSHSAEIDDIRMDSDGIQTDLLSDRLKELRRRGTSPTMLYVIPNFQNPTGVTLSESRRKELIGMANEYDFLILEDDPYGQLRYGGDALPPVKSFDDVGRVIYASSFSKILSPGIRVGWVVAHKEIIRKLSIMKQTADVHTGVLSQKIANEYLRGGHLDTQLTIIREMYGRKQRTMLTALDQFFPEETHWTHPQGGMFLWATLPDSIDTLRLLPKAIEKKVAYMHGRLFYPNGGGESEMRLNFTHASDEMITEGIRRLGGLIDAELRSH